MAGDYEWNEKRHAHWLSGAATLLFELLPVYSWPVDYHCRRIAPSSVGHIFSRGYFGSRIPAMAKVKIEIWGYKCERCGHEWVPRNEPTPLVCPKCKSPYWNRPRRAKKGGESRGDRK